MSLALKNKVSNTNWQPTASINQLKQRTAVIKKIRAFLTERNLLEVETPLLSHSSIPDPHIESFNTGNYYLQTSPEFAMKRLLAAGSGDIFQLCKAFRVGEQGHKHNPEFTILEWYRVGFDHHDLMQDVDEFLQSILNSAPAEKVSYCDLFLRHLDINPFDTSSDQLQNCAINHKLNTSELSNKDDWLDLLLSHLIEPTLGLDKPVFIYDYPPTQAALAKLRHDEFNVAERFECYYKGIELANGFHELADVKLQRQRFIADNEQRIATKQQPIPLDENLLSALENGMPDCAGVALGIDRLMMLTLNTNQIADVLSFTMDRA